MMKNLYRSRTQRMLGGICGGMGKYFDIDPAIIRVIWVFALIATCFAAFLAYVLAWVIIPEEPAAG